MAMDSAGPADALQAAQLEKLQLENEKLKLELAGLKRAKPWHGALTPIVPLVTAVLAILSFLYGVLQYQEAQKQNRATQERRAELDRHTAEQEFMKPWIQSQREIYLDALSAAATIANSESPNRIPEAVEKFWQLYHGKMIVIETKNVSDAMISFGRCLDGKESCDRDELNKRSHALASEMARSMGATGTMTFAQFVENQHQYLQSIKP